MIPGTLARHGLTLLFDASLKSLLILALVGLALLLGRRASASARHLTALLGLVSFLILPLLTLALPGWRVPLWPRQTMALPIPASPLNVPPDALPPLPPVAPGPDAASPIPAPPVTAAPVLPPTMPAAPVRRPFPWPIALFAVWLLGVCIFLSPTLAGLLAVHRLGRRCRRLTDGPIVALAHTVWQGRPLALLCGDPSDASVVPMTWGWLRPVVLLPAGAEGWPPDRLRVVLLHELAHIRRGDWPCQMLAHIVCALYWFHPGAWLLARQLRLESERACDDLVLAAGVPPGDYARHLLEVIKSMKITDNTLKVVLPMAQPSQVESRIRDVIARNRNRGALSRRIVSSICAAMVIVLVPLAALRPMAKTQATRPPVLPAGAGVTPITPALAVARLKQIYQFVQIYRHRHGGAYPATLSTPGDLMGDMAAHPLDYGLEDRGADNGRQAVSFFTLAKPGDTGLPNVITIVMHGKRPDGSRVGSAKRAETRDVLADTNIFVNNKKFTQGWRTVGDYLVLWDDGKVTRVPGDKILAVPLYDPIGGRQTVIGIPPVHPLQMAFPGQAGLPATGVKKI